VCLWIPPPPQNFNAWTSLYETWYVYHGNWVYLSDVLHKSLPLVCVSVCLFLSSLLGNGSVKCIPQKSYLLAIHDHLPISFGIMYYVCVSILSSNPFSCKKFLNLSLWKCNSASFIYSYKCWVYSVSSEALYISISHLWQTFSVRLKRADFLSTAPTRSPHLYTPLASVTIFLAKCLYKSQFVNLHISTPKMEEPYSPETSVSTYKTTNYWVFLLCPLSSILKNTTFGNWICFRPHLRGETSDKGNRPSFRNVVFSSF
jgi:hypothetical protein